MSTFKYKYPHIPNLMTMQPTPRMLLGQRLYWTEEFKNVRVAMPKVAMAIGKECEMHFYSRPTGKLFMYYKKYLEKLA